MTAARIMRKLNQISSRHLSAGLLLAIAMCALVGSADPLTNGRRQSQFAARRAADDSRPLIRLASHRRSLDASENQDSGAVVVGKFKAPAPERIQRARLPKSSQFAAQTMSASYRVSDQADSSQPEKVVHGLVNQSKQRVVGAKIQVSDEGLNYPPSKLSADIYGNVAEIVTAPPEAVDNDFLIPSSRRFQPNSG